MVRFCLYSYRQLSRKSLTFLFLLFFTFIVVLIPTSIAAADQFTVNFSNPGTSWYGFSLPLWPDSAYTAETLLQEINNQGGSATTIRRWDGSQWVTHDIGLPFNNFPIEVGEGYFIKTDGPSNFTIEGSPVPEVSMVLNSGWNFISIPTLKLPGSYKAADLAEEIEQQGGDVTIVRRWNASQWDSYYLDLPISPIGNNFDVARGEAYFVNVTNKSAFLTLATDNTSPVNVLWTTITDSQTQFRLEKNVTNYLGNFSQLDPVNGKALWDVDAEIMPNGRFAYIPLQEGSVYAPASQMKVRVVRVNLTNGDTETVAYFPGWLYYGVGRDIVFSSDNKFALLASDNPIDGKMEVRRFTNLDPSQGAPMPTVELVDSGESFWGNYIIIGADVDIAISPDNKRALLIAFENPWSVDIVRLYNLDTPDPQAEVVVTGPFVVTGQDVVFVEGGNFALVPLFNVFSPKLYRINMLNGTSEEVSYEANDGYEVHDVDLVTSPDRNVALFPTLEIPTPTETRLWAIEPAATGIPQLIDTTPSGVINLDIDICFTKDSKYAFAAYKIIGNHTVIKRYDFSSWPPAVTVVESSPTDDDGITAFDYFPGMGIDMGLADDDSYLLAALLKIGSTPAEDSIKILKIDVDTAQVVWENTLSGHLPLRHVDFAMTPPTYVDKIAFRSDRDGGEPEIYIMNTDGSNQVRLTNNAAHDDAPAISPDGSKIAFRSDQDGDGEIFVMNSNGSNPVQLTSNSAFDTNPAWSPDGTKIVFASEQAGNREVYIMNSDGTNQINLTNDPAYDDEPAFSPDGSKIVFTSTRSGNLEIWVMDDDGTNPVNLTNDPVQDKQPVFSPDGSYIYFRRTDAGNFEIYRMDANGANQVNITQSPLQEEDPSISPDGSKIAYHAWEIGNPDVYVMNADGSNQEPLTTDPAPDQSPSWSHATENALFATYSETNTPEIFLHRLHNINSPTPTLEENLYSFPTEQLGTEGYHPQDDIDFSLAANDGNVATFLASSNLLLIKGVNGVIAPTITPIGPLSSEPVAGVDLASNYPAYNNSPAYNTPQGIPHRDEDFPDSGVITRPRPERQKFSWQDPSSEVHTTIAATFDQPGLIEVEKLGYPPNLQQTTDGKLIQIISARQINSTAQFQGDATVTFHLTEEEFSDLSPTGAIYVYTSQGWERLPTTVVPSQRTVTGTTSHLSIFGIGNPTVPTGVNTYWIGALALLAMAAGFVVIRKTRVLKGKG